MRQQGNEHGQSHHLPQPPPPPYSETDLYSRTSAAQTTSSNGADDGRASSAASEVVLTPPETPNAIPGYQTVAAQHDDEQLRNPLEDRDSAHVDTPPAVLDYFASRPLISQTSLSGGRLVHPIQVQASSTPDDFVFPSNFQGRDVLPQDWATFLNFLLPDHDYQQNQNVLDHKIRQEREASAPWEGDAAAGTDETASAPLSEKSHLESRERLTASRGRLTKEDEGRSDEEDRQRMKHACTTACQWNEGFFGPRGIEIVIETNTAGAGGAARGSERTQLPGQRGGHRNGRDRWQMGNTSMNSEGIRYGDRFVMDSNGIRHGDSFVMDSEGIRIGRLFMGSNGIRMGSRDDCQGVRGQTGGCRGQRGRGRAGGRDLPGSPSARGNCDSGRGLRQAHRDIGGQPHHEQPRGYGPGGNIGTAAESHSGGRPRGRYPDPHDSLHQHRSRSVDSDGSSTSSSSSSSSSGSSIGSVPDHDDVGDQALPLYLQRLNEWIQHPEKHRTKADVRRLRQEMELPQAQLTGDNARDSKALRDQIKALRKQWRSVRRAQKKIRRAERKERRRQRKAERRERKQVRREMKRSRRDVRRGKRRAEPEHDPPSGLSQARAHMAEPAPAQTSWGGMFGWRSEQNRQTPPMTRALPGDYSTQQRPPSYHEKPSPTKGDSLDYVTPQPGSASENLFLEAARLESERDQVSERLGAMQDGSEKRSMEKQVEAMTEQVTQMRLQADEQFAMELGGTQ